MRKKKWITVLSLLVLTVMLLVKTPSWINADGTGRELQADDFTKFDMFFANNDHSIMTKEDTRNITLTSLPSSYNVNFRAEVDLSKITKPGESNPQTAAGKRLMPGDYFLIELPDALPIPKDFLNKNTSKILHEGSTENNELVLANMEQVTTSSGKNAFKVIFTDLINNPLYTDNVKCYVFVTVTASSSELKKVEYTFKTPTEEKKFNLSYTFQNTDAPEEVLYKNGGAYLSDGSGFSYSLRINIRERKLGTIVIEDNLLDGFKDKNLKNLDGIDYVEKYFAMSQRKYEKIGDVYSSKSEIVKDAQGKDIYLDAAKLMSGDGVTTPKLVVDKVNKKFTLTIPNVDTKTFFFVYRVNNPNDGRFLNNSVKISEKVGDTLVPLYPDARHKNKNQYEFFGNTAFLKISAGGGGVSDGKLGTVEIKKVGYKDAALKDIEFKLKNKETGAYTESLATDENGRVTFENLAFGTYIIEEVNAPAGYKKVAPIEVSVKDSKAVLKLIKNELEKLPNIEVVVNKICKVDPQAGTILPQDDKSSDMTLVLERKVKGDQFEPVQKADGTLYEVVLAKNAESAKFTDVERADSNGNAYEFRLAEKLDNGKSPSGIEFSTPVVNDDKVVINLTKDCSAPKTVPNQVEKIDVEVTKVCKVDPQNPSAPNTPANEDKGADITLVLQRKLDGGEFETVKDAGGKDLEVVLKKDEEKVIFPQVDKTDKDGALYVYQVVEKTLEGQTPSGLEFSTPVVEANKTSIQVMKDCSAPKAEDPKKEDPKKEDSKKEESKPQEPTESTSSNEGSGTVSKVEHVETPETPETPKTSNENSPEQPQKGVTAEGTKVEKIETNVLPGNVPANSGTDTSKNNKAVNPANKKLPKTGEGLNATAYAAIALLGGASLVAYGVFRKKKTQA